MAAESFSKTLGTTMPSGSAESSEPLATSSGWSAKYGAKHRLVRVADFGPGIRAPKRVRVYFRHDHYVLQWWDPAAKSNLSDRIDGDLIEAVGKARAIEERLSHFRSATPLREQKISLLALVRRFEADARTRAEAGEIAPGTARRYEDALVHFTAFCQRPEVSRRYPKASQVDREFRLQFCKHLDGVRVSANGRPNSRSGPMRSSAFVLDVVRSLFEWSADPARGAILPEGFRNPFRRGAGARRETHADPLAPPDITIPMAVRLVEECDEWQLRLFVPMLLFGLRAAEPCCLFGEHLEAEWLRVPCQPELGYVTKGRREKRFPLLEELSPLWDALRVSADKGLLFRRRSPDTSTMEPQRNWSRAEIIATWDRQCADQASDASCRERLRKDVLRRAGGLDYDVIQHEFDDLKARLEWPACATLKDLRHLFATSTNNAFMPEAYRRYLMGQSPGKAAIVTYTHLNELRRHYVDGMRREMQPVITAVMQKIGPLRMTEY